MKPDLSRDREKIEDVINEQVVRTRWDHDKKINIAYWSFVTHGVLEMVKCFWDTGKLVVRVLEEIIKLLPKSANRQDIVNWRLITLLNTTIFRRI